MNKWQKCDSIKQIPDITAKCVYLTQCVWPEAGNVSTPHNKHEWPEVGTVYWKQRHGIPRTKALGNIHEMHILCIDSGHTIKDLKKPEIHMQSYSDIFGHILTLIPSVQVANTEQSDLINMTVWGNSGVSKNFAWPLSLRSPGKILRCWLNCIFIVFSAGQPFVSV